MNIIAIIPARSGSKGIKNKNISDVAGFPLLAYSIAAAKLTSKISRIIVSTDSDEYARIAEFYGADVPFLRPSEISGDKSLDIEYLDYTLKKLKETDGKEVDLVVLLRPTTPIRDPKDIEDAIDSLLERDDASSVVSVKETPECPYKWVKMDQWGFISSPFSELATDDVNLPRQSFPKTYIPDGYVDVLRSDEITMNGKVYGDKAYAWINRHEFIDIDTAKDLNEVRESSIENCIVFKYLIDNYGGAKC